MDYSCAKFGDFSFSRLVSSCRQTDRQTDRQNHRRRWTLYSRDCRRREWIQTGTKCVDEEDYWFSIVDVTGTDYCRALPAPAGNWPRFRRTDELYCIKETGLLTTWDQLILFAAIFKRFSFVRTMDVCSLYVMLLYRQTSMVRTLVYMHWSSPDSRKPCGWH